MNNKILGIISLILIIFLLLPTTTIKQYSETESFTDYREEYKTLKYSSHGVTSNVPMTAIYGVTNEEDVGGIFSASILIYPKSYQGEVSTLDSPDGVDKILIIKSEYIEGHGYHEFEFNNIGIMAFKGITAPTVLVKVPFTNYREVQRYKTIDIRMYQKIFGLY